MKNILITLFILATAFLYAGDPDLNSVEGMTDDFYYKFFGVWDEELLKDFEGTPMRFSWGLGELLKNSSTIIDFNLFVEKDALYFYGLGLREIIKIEEMNDNTFKILLYWEYRDETGTIIVHWVEDNIIWFETVGQYENRIGLSEDLDIPYGEVSYSNGNVVTGPDNFYYRRSGPLRE